MTSPNETENSKSNHHPEKSFIDELDETLSEFLKREQPSYDPADKPPTLSHIPPPPKEPLQKPEPKRERWSLRDFWRPFSKPPFDPPEPKFPRQPQDESDRTNQDQPENKTRIFRRPTDEEMLRKEAEVQETVEIYKNTKREAHKASLINCAELEMELFNCFKNGSLLQRLNICDRARSRFWKCMDQQQEFLSKTGYKHHSKTEEQNELILYEADLLAQKTFPINRQDEQENGNADDATGKSTS